MNYSKLYEDLFEQIGAEEWKKRSIARGELYNNYGFCPDITRIAIYESPEQFIRFGVGRHVYEYCYNDGELTKVE